MSDIETKQKIIKSTNDLSLLQIMGMNRAERRRIAKLNGIKKIDGSMKAYVNPSKKEISS